MKMKVMTTNRGKSWTREEIPVNGTEGQTDWNSVNWREANDNVRRLRQRIFRATQEGNFKKVRSLQKLMLRSHSNRLTSVRRVTQINKGKNTAGVDKILVKTPRSRGLLVDQLATITPWNAKPAKRVYIPKASGKKRPLGIPVIFDRALQAMVKNALEPSWEAKFEGTSYGFRPGRGCHDAIAQTFMLAKGNSAKQWVLDADIQGAFDNISHEYLLRTIGPVPGRELIRQWLKAGYVEMGTLHPTEAGTPQGGVISPLLANIALHGMEEALGIKFKPKGKKMQRSNVSTRSLVRYADDFVAFCKTKEDAEQAKSILEQWLAERGLEFSQEKTRVVHLTEGFDFLSFNIRHYAVNDRSTGAKLLIKPSKTAVKKCKDDLRKRWMELRGSNPELVCKLLNPKIKGWANYFRIGVSSETFHALDHFMYKRVISHLRHKHSRRPFHWYQEKGYLGQIHPTRKDRYVFGNRAKKCYLNKFAWAKIERHIMVKGTYSPDDPSLVEYWENRKMERIFHEPTKKRRALAFRQKGVCPICGESIIQSGDDTTEIVTLEEVQEHHVKARKDGGSDLWKNLKLVHLYCHQAIHANMKTDEEPEDEGTEA